MNRINQTVMPDDANAHCPGEPPAVQPLIALLHQLFDLVALLSNEEYTRKPVGVVESSIGGHVRHNLDHVAALLRGLSAGEINYDQRDRGTAVEHDRIAALEAILRLAHELARFPWDHVPDALNLNALVAPDRPAVAAATSPGRELAFVISHTIHHNALIRVMLQLLGAHVAPDFGYAPSTILNQRSRACVR
jgi:uncharacterized damage-inducible protein DinB